MYPDYSICFCLSQFGLSAPCSGVKVNIVCIKYEYKLRKHEYLVAVEWCADAKLQLTNTAIQSLCIYKTKGS